VVFIKYRNSQIADVSTPNEIWLWLSLSMGNVQTDHEIVRKGVRTLFTNNDSLKVCGEAQNGIEAIRMVGDLSPDVVILDLTMPGMTGFETAAKIREIAPSIRIIFFTIHDIPAAAWWVGADACVSKSSPLQELTLTVNRVLQLRGNVQP
jgi:DNA-binding NarL/FixJ family response regulator